LKVAAPAAEALHSKGTAPASADTPRRSALALFRRTRDIDILPHVKVTSPGRIGWLDRPPRRLIATSWPRLLAQSDGNVAKHAAAAAPKQMR
jgi:hypothetical protein